MSGADQLVGKSRCLLFPSPPHPGVKTASWTECQGSRAPSPPARVPGCPTGERRDVARPEHAVPRGTGQRAGRHLRGLPLLGAPLSPGAWLCGRRLLRMSPGASSGSLGGKQNLRPYPRPAESGTLDAVPGLVVSATSPADSDAP